MIKRKKEAEKKIILHLITNERVRLSNSVDAEYLPNI